MVYDSVLDVSKGSNAFLLKSQYFLEDGFAFLRNVGIRLRHDAASYATRTEFAATALPIAENWHACYGLRFGKKEKTSCALT